MKKKHFLLIYFVLITSAFAQIALPTDGLKHHFTFDNAGNLEVATVGNNLTRDALDGITQTFNSVAGPTGTNGAVEVGLGSFYRLDLDFDPNGPDTAKRVNQFSLVIDFYLPQSGVWYAFHAATNDGNPIESDWESFVKSSGAIGVGSTGYSYYKVPEKEWHRLIISSDLGNSYKYYLDGQLAQDGGKNKPEDIDGRLSLPSIDGANQILLFGDNDSEDANIYISELAVYDRPITEEEAWDMKGFNHSIPLEIPTGLWSFDDSEDLTAPFYGSPLELVGTQIAVEGPETTDGAVQVGIGSHYIASHNMAANGGGERVNLYSVAIDFKVNNLGSMYSLLQTDPTNTSDAELFVNAEGKVGVNDLGYTDSSIVAGEWYKLVMVSDSNNQVTLFLDADSVLDGGNQDLDGRFSINPREMDNKLLLFADNDGGDGSIEVANITVYNRPLSKDEVIGLGSYYHGPTNTEVTGSKKTVYFNGTDVNNKYGKITKTNDDFNFGEGDFTIEVWVKPDISYSSDPSLISDKDWGSGSNPGWVLSIRGDDWKFNAADENRNRYDVSGPNISDGNWHHLVVIAKQDSGLKLITDDLETVWAGGEDFFKVGNIDNPSLPLCIAQDGTGLYSDGPPSPAQVDEVRIWKGVALEPEVIFAWRNKAINDSHPNKSALVGYWKFDEGSGTSVSDMSGHGHNVELIGNPKWEISYAALGNESIQSMNDVNAIWGSVASSKSGGISIDASFPVPLVPARFSVDQDILPSIQAKEDNPYLVFGHNNETTATTSGVPSDLEARLARVWDFDITETPVSNPIITFDLSELGGSGNAGEASNYVLLKSASINGAYSPVDGNISVEEDKIAFNGIDLSDGYYTLGSKSLSASPLGGLVVGVEANEVIPAQFNLSQNYPNPFNPSTKINFGLPVNSKVTLAIYNTLGQIVDVLINKEMNAGYHDVEWNAATKNLSSGIYIYRLHASGVDGKEFSKSNKLMLLK